MSGRQVTVPAEALAVVLALFPDPVRSDRLGDYRPEVAEAVQALRAALAQPQPQPSPSAGEVLRQIERVLETHEAVQNMTRYCKVCEAPALDKYDFTFPLLHEDDCPIPYLRALTAPQPMPEREALAQRIAEMREHHEGVKKRARARMEEAGDVPVKAYYAKMFDTHSIIAGELEELAALATIPDSGLSGIPAISDKPMPEREALAEAASAVLGEFDDGYLRPMATYDQRERLTVTKEAVGRLRAALVRLTAPADAGGEP